VHRGCPSRGLLALARACEKAQPSRSHLAPQLVDCLLLSLLSLNFSAVLPLLETDILEVDPAATGLVPKDLLLYCLYAAQLFLALKRFDRAAELLLQALVAPSPALNAIQLAAYKKLVLASLLSGGVPPPVPKYASAALHRHLKGATEAYAELEKAFLSRSAAQLEAQLKAHGDAFKADGNWGLVCQLVGAQPRRATQRLTGTFLTLPLSDLGRQASLGGAEPMGAAEAALLVREMVRRGEIWASVDARTGLASFREEPEQYCTRAVARRIAARLNATLELDARARALDIALQAAPSYQSKDLLHSERGAKASAMDMSD
jgi:COP9 signalosome complex subunit 3